MKKEQMLNDKILFVPDKVLENLGWDEKILLELEHTDDGWIIKQSKVAASKFLGFSDGD
jgi:bifunctional DNA-binding transcriptional regulator/antitoxin component of YhaV-PrlF toxin-antitoxin module